MKSKTPPTINFIHLIVFLNVPGLKPASHLLNGQYLKTTLPTSWSLSTKPTSPNGYLHYFVCYHLKLNTYL